MKKLIRKWLEIEDCKAPPKAKDYDYKQLEDRIEGLLKREWQRDNPSKFKVRDIVDYDRFFVTVKRNCIITKVHTERLFFGDSYEYKYDMIDGNGDLEEKMDEVFLYLPTPPPTFPDRTPIKKTSKKIAKPETTKK